MDTLFWNTGRQYTAKGQRLMAQRTERGSWLFADFDRMIYGETKEAAPDWAVSEPTLIRWVQGQYDNGAYHMSTEAMNLCAGDTQKFTSARL